MLMLWIVPEMQEKSNRDLINGESDEKANLSRDVCWQTFIDSSSCKAGIG
jgi:hypothetical protein